MVAVMGRGHDGCWPEAWKGLRAVGIDPKSGDGRNVPFPALFRVEQRRREVDLAAVIVMLEGAHEHRLQFVRVVVELLPHLVEALTGPPSREEHGVACVVSQDML